ncbi:MAG: 50S ribosomal protein L23 [Gemmatimonadetes bacterium]|nr:50S ribosomal protein L23 [Gemmatimonadota bacterium]
MPDRFRTVIRPLVTEKSSALYAAVTPKGRALKEYTFRADPRASKREISAAIEALFGVHVAHIRTLQQRAKLKTRGRTVGTVPRWKKAYVRLKEGESIPVFEG